MNSGNDTTSSIKKLTGNKKLLFIPLGCLVLICICCFITFLIGYFLPPSIQLVSNDNGKTLIDPKYTIQLKCSGVDEIILNSKTLTDKEEDQICSKSGYEVNLVNGENKFQIQGKSLRGETVNLDIVLVFDEVKYKETLALAEQERQKAEAENQAKTENEAKQKAEEEQKSKSEWKAKYQNYKTSNIDVNFAKSTEMIQILSNGVDSYQSRNQAKAYKEYFVSKCKANMNNDLATIPSDLTKQIKELNDSYSDFCLYNYSLASQVVSYFESSSVSDQYAKLDMITYYMGEVNNAKLDMEIKISELESIISSY